MNALIVSLIKINEKYEIDFSLVDNLIYSLADINRSTLKFYRENDKILSHRKNTS